jgi:hypothetical protein
MRLPISSRAITGLASAAAAVTLACTAALSAQGSASGCRTADTVRVPARLAFLKDLVSSADSDFVSSRQDLGVAASNPAKVALVTKQTTCQTAVTALNAVRQEPGVVRQIWLYSMATGYALDDPTRDVFGTDRVLYMFDTQFNYKRTFSGF